MTTESPVITTAIPDLNQIPVDRLAKLGGSPLARSIELYRERLAGSGEPPRSFNSMI